MISLLKLSWPNSLQGHCLLNSGSLWRKRGRMSSESRYLEVQCSGSTIDCPSSVAASTTVGSPSPTSSRLPLISPVPPNPCLWCGDALPSLTQYLKWIHIDRVVLLLFWFFLLVFPPHSCSAKCPLNRYRKSLFAPLCILVLKIVFIDRSSQLNIPKKKQTLTLYNSIKSIK